MLTIDKILCDLSTTILAILIGILVYKKLPPFYRILFFQALVYLVIDSYASNVTENAKIYNIGITLEVSFIFLAAYIYFNTVKGKRILLVLFAVFLSLLFFDLYSLPTTYLVYHAYIAAGIITTFIYITILFFHFIERKDDYMTPPLLLTSIGVIIYFAGMVPYLSVMYNFQQKDSEYNQFLFQKIIVILCIIRYLCIALAFFLLGKFQFKAFKPS